MAKPSKKRLRDAPSKTSPSPKKTKTKTKTKSKSKPSKSSKSKSSTPPSFPFTFHTLPSSISLSPTTRRLSKRARSIDGVDASVAPPLEPLLAVFPQGFSLSPLQTLGAFRHADHRRSHQRLLSMRSDTISISARGAAPTGAQRYLVFRLDGKGNAALLNRAECNQVVFSVRQSLPRGNDAAVKALGGDTTQELTYLEKRNRLIAAFGSRKSRKAVKTAEDGKVSSQHLVGSTALENLLQSTNDGNSAGINGNNGNSAGINGNSGNGGNRKGLEARRRLLPPFEVDATKVAQIYPLEGLLPVRLRKAKGMKEEVMRRWKQARGRKKAAKEEADPGSEYVAYAVKKAAGMEEKKKAKQRLRLCVMAQQLLSFMRCRSVISVDTKSNDSARLGMMQEAFDHCANTFGTEMVDSEGSMVVSRQARDRVNLYLLALCLHIERFEVSVEALEKLSTDMRKPLPKLVDLLKELGCSPVKDGKKLRAMVLKTPLTFPKTKRNKAPPRRR